MVIPTFKVIFTPLEHIPNMPPRSSYVINICLYLAKTLLFFGLRFYKTIDIYRTRDFRTSILNITTNFNWCSLPFLLMQESTRPPKAYLDFQATHWTADTNMHHAHLTRSPSTHTIGQTQILKPVLCPEIVYHSCSCQLRIYN